MAQITLNSSGVASNGSLLLQSNGTTTAVTIDTAQNMGLGVTPSAWASRTVLEVGAAGNAFVSGGAGDVYVTEGCYYNAGWKYGNSLYATALYNQYRGTHSWSTAASGTAGNTISFTQAMTLDASGNLRLGTTGSSDARLYVRGAGTTSATASFEAANSSGATRLFVQDDGTTRFFGSAGSETARITSGGNLLVGKNSRAFATAGVDLSPTQDSHFTISGIVAAFNRLDTDGIIIELAQANTVEGNISVSGTTVSYNGGHLSRWAQTTTAKDDSLVKGTVLSNLDEMNVYTDSEGNPVPNEQLNKVKVSDTEGDANVAGVFVNWSHDEDHNVDEINMAMTGDMIIRIAQGTTVQRGDLLMSAGNGTAKPQGDDIVRSKTVAKVTSTHVTCTYADGSYCVPCVLMAC